jgi:hypothetical protein
MITPAYSATSTERVLPRMALDFTTGVLDPRVTVARALDTATRINSSGFIEVVNANLPRFDYDPATLAPKGLLIEEARTNLFTNSEFPNGVTDAPVRGGLLTGTTFAGLFGNAGLAFGYDGVTTTFAYKAGSVTGTTYGMSVFVRMDDGGPPVFGSSTPSNVANSFVFVVGGNLPNPTSFQVTNMGGGLYRVSAAATAGAIPLNSGVLKYSTNDSRTFKVSGYQLEVGGFATSYIPTTTTSLTRNADAVSMTGTNFSSWFNASEGAVFVQIFRGDATGASRGAWRIDSGATNNGMDYRPYGSNNTVNITGVSQVDIYPGGGVANSVVRNVFGYKVNNFAAATNGGAAVTDTLGNLPTVNQMVIGGLSSATGQILCGHVQKMSYWPQRLTEAEIRAFSK